MAIAEKIDKEIMSQRLSFVMHNEVFLSLIGDATQLKLYLQGISIQLFRKPVSNSFMYLYSRAIHFIYFGFDGFILYRVLTEHNLLWICFFMAKVIHFSQS